MGIGMLRGAVCLVPLDCADRCQVEGSRLGEYCAKSGGDVTGLEGVMNWAGGSLYYVLCTADDGDQGDEVVQQMYGKGSVNNAAKRACRG